MKLKIKVDDPVCLPTRSNPTDAGLDLRSTKTLVVLPSGGIKLVDTGVSVKIPEGFVGLIFSRSGHGGIKVRLANSVGVIDSDYRGNLKVLIENNGSEPFEITYGVTKVAQLVVVPIVIPELEVVGEEGWNDTARGLGGFGSTG